MGTEVIPHTIEPIINAALAAAAAQQAAYQSLVISLIILVVASATLGVFVYIAYKFARLEHNTNAMREQLVEATRALALIEGRAAGRLEKGNI